MTVFDESFTGRQNRFQNYIRILVPPRIRQADPRQRPGYERGASPLHTDSRYPLFRWWRSQSLVPEAAIERTVCYLFPVSPWLPEDEFSSELQRVLYIELTTGTIVQRRFCRPYLDFNDWSKASLDRVMVDTLLPRRVSIESRNIKKILLWNEDIFSKRFKLSYILKNNNDGKIMWIINNFNY